MKSSTVRLFAVVASLLLAASVMWFIADLAVQTRQGSVEAEHSFGWLARQFNTITDQNDFLSPQWLEQADQISVKSRLVSAIRIQYAGKSVYSWDRGTHYIEYDENGYPVNSAESLFTRIYSGSLDAGTQHSGRVVLVAVMQVLPRGAIHTASRNLFLSVLTILLVTLIVIILNTNNTSPVLQSRREPAVSGGNSPSTPSVTRTGSGSDLRENPEAAEYIGTAVIESEISTDSNRLSDPDHIDDMATPPVVAPKKGFVSESVDSTVLEPSPELDPVEHAMARPVPPPKAPEGLFSPITGIGWESYLEVRLDSELERAAASEQDLALFLIRLPGVVRTDLVCRKVIKLLLDLFKFRDLLFEYGTDGFAVFMQNVNLDQAMNQAEQLHDGITALYRELDFSASVYIGVTTRTSRLLPAARMIEEAAGAVQKAESETDLPIVAYRANPEKYRSFPSC